MDIGVNGSFGVVDPAKAKSAELAARASAEAANAAAKKPEPPRDEARTDDTSRPVDAKRAADAANEIQRQENYLRQAYASSQRT